MRISEVDPKFIPESYRANGPDDEPGGEAGGIVPGDDVARKTFGEPQPKPEPGVLDTIKSAADYLGHEFKKRFPQVGANPDAGLPAYHIQNKYSTYPPSVYTTDRNFIQEKNHVWIEVSKHFTEITPEVEQKANTQGFKKVLLILQSKKVPALLSGTKCYVSQSVMDEIMKENKGEMMFINEHLTSTELTESDRIIALKKMLVG
jgi:hypothetical protein